MLSHGFQVARGAAPPAACALVRSEALASRRHRGTGRCCALPTSGRWAAACGASAAACICRCSFRRLWTLLRAALSPGTGLADAFRSAGLSSDAHLVELSVMLALPGARSRCVAT